MTQSGSSFHAARIAFPRNSLVSGRLTGLIHVLHAADLSAMDSRSEFRLKLTVVASNIDIERFARLKYLCSDKIPAGDLEKIKTPEELFLELEQRKQIEQNRLTFLICCLENIGRKDLADDLKSYECERKEGKHFLFIDENQILLNVLAN